MMSYFVKKKSVDLEKISALPCSFTIVQIRKQAKCPLVGEWIMMWCLYTMEYLLFSQEKEGHPTICDNTDGP